MDKKEVRLFTEEIETVYRRSPMAIAIYYASEDGFKCYLLSDGFCEMFEDTEENLKVRLNGNDPFVNILEKEDLIKVTMDFVKYDKPFNVVFREYVGPNRKLITVHGIGKHIYNEDGVRYSVVNYDEITDASRRKLFDAELQYQKRLQTVYDIIDAYRWQWKIDSDGNMYDMSWNDKVREVYGYDHESISGTAVETWINHLAPEDMNYVLEYTSKFNDPDNLDAVYDLKYRMINKDGEIRWVYAKGRKILDVDGNPTEALGTFWDITDKKDLEDQRNVISVLADEYSSVYGVNIVEDNIRVYKQSSRVNELIGDQIYSMPFTGAMKTYIEMGVDDHDQEDMKRITTIGYIQEQLKTNRSFSRIYHNNEGQFCELKIARVDEENIVIGYAVKDVAIRQELQRQEELKVALDMAESANRAKTTFLNNMSHDIRTPMNAIIGFTNLATSHIDEPELVQDYLSKIGESSEHLLALINDVLDMSRIESGKMTIHEEQEDLLEIIQTLIDIIQADVTANRQSLSVDTIDLTLDNIICDKLRLNQVMLNVLTNAIKYTQEEGNIALVVTKLQSDKPGFGKFRFVVQDNGIGMSQEFLGTIFEPFTRVQTSTKSGVQGTGLGMSITRSIVDMMNGDIHIDSEEGKGTTVTIEFQFKLVPVEDGDKKDVNLHIGDSNRLQARDFTGKHILLVEDNDLNMEIARLILEENGFIVDTVEDGTEAVEKLRVADAGEYDVILMDIQMPNMNGYEATRVIRRMGKMGISDIPIIAMTANAFEEDIRDARAAGMNGHVAKPIDIDKLWKQLDEVLD